MTQQHIRNVLGIFLVMSMVAYLVTITYLHFVGEHRLKRIYLVEMLRRVGSVTAILNWMPLTAILTPTATAAVSGIVPFDLNLLTLNESNVRTMTVDETFPHTAYQYSPTIQRVVSLRETFGVQPVRGCPSAVLIVSVSVAGLSAVLSIFAMQLANFVARLGHVSGSPWKVVAGRVLVVLAFLMPLIFSPAFLYGSAKLQGRCAVMDWKDDVRRSAMIVAETYGTMLDNFPLQTNLTSLEATFGRLNEAVFGDHDFSLHVVNHATKSVQPPVENAEAAAIFVQSLAGDLNFAEYLEDSGLVIATYGMPESAVTIAAVKDVAAIVPRPSSMMTRLAAALLVVPLAVIAACALVFFPYSSVGLLTGGEAHLGPWAWRSSRHWPLWKFVQVGLLIGFGVFAAMYNAERLSTFVNVSNIRVDNLDQIVQGGKNMVAMGNQLLNNYEMMMEGVDWTTAFMNGVPGFTSEDEVSMNAFYQSLFSTMNGLTYTLASAAELAATRTPDELPLLINREEVDGFLLSNFNAGPALNMLLGLVMLFDAKTMFYILTSDVEGMENGSNISTPLILYYANQIAGAEGQALFETVIDATLRNTAEYVEIAKTFAAQTERESSVVSLMASTAGRAVVAMEQSAVNYELSQWPSTTKYDSIYTFIETSYVSWPLAVLGVSGLVVVLDFYLMAGFFGGSRGSRDAAAVKQMHNASLFPASPASSPSLSDTAATTPAGPPGSVDPTAILPPSNDYTAPRSYLTVDHFHLWRCVHIGAFASAIVALLSMLLVWCSYTKSQTEVQSIVRSRTYEEQNAVSLRNLATTAGAMPVSIAFWLRAYLSLAEADIVSAATVTYIWSEVIETSWVDGKPSSTSDTSTDEPNQNVVDTEVSETQLRDELRHLSNLVDALMFGVAEGVVGVTVYGDFVQLLNEFQTYFPFATLQTCTSADPYSFSNLGSTIANLMYAFIYLYDDDYVNDAISQITTFISENPTCGMDEDSTTLYIQQVMALRRRAVFFSPRQQLASDVAAASKASTQDNLLAMESSMATVSSYSFSTLAAPWMVVLMSWLSLPFIYIVVKASQKVHRNIYFS